MEQPKLLPCPFCGATSESLVQLDKHTDKRLSYTEYFVICQECGAQSMADSDKNHVVKMWNQRVEPEPKWCAMCKYETNGEIERPFYDHIDTILQRKRVKIPVCEHHHTLMSLALKHPARVILNDPTIEDTHWNGVPIRALIAQWSVKP